MPIGHIRMNRTFITIVGVALALVTFLVWQASTSETSAVMLPSQLAAAPTIEKHRIRVAGRVTADPVNYQVEPNILLEFSINDPGQKVGTSIPVTYNGIKPDMFASGRDVIIDGDFLGGRVVASKLLTQCPSKYEPPDPKKVKYEVK